MNGIEAGTIIAVVAMGILFTWGITKLAEVSSNNSWKAMCERYDNARKLYVEGQTITLKEDYFGEDVVFRKGRVGRITELKLNYKDAIVAFGDFEIGINLLDLKDYI